jgi:cobalt-zinc-cadmium efflux system protein
MNTDDNRQFSVSPSHISDQLFGGLHYRSLALVTDASFMAINITSQLIAMYVARITGELPQNTFG